MNDIKQEKSSFLSSNEYDEEHFNPIYALHDCNSYDVKAKPNHTHHLTWPHPLPGLTTSELPEPPLQRMAKVDAKSAYRNNIPVHLED